MIDHEYTPNPSLQVLYRELELLNTRLIKQRLNDRARLQRMRSFAQSTLGSHFRIATFGGAESAADSYSQRLPGTAQNPRGGRWMATIGFEGRKLYLGTFDSAEEAHAVYRAKHVDLYGTASMYHPDNADAYPPEFMAYAATLGLTTEDLAGA